MNTETLASPSNLAAKNVKSLKLIRQYWGEESAIFDKLLERFSFAFTANVKRQTANGRLLLVVKARNYFILAYFSVFSTCSIAVTNR